MWLTSGSMWIKAVAKITPPPKHKSIEVTFFFHAFSEEYKYFPTQIGRNPKIREIPPKSNIEMIFAVTTSMFKVRKDLGNSHTDFLSYVES